MLRDIDLKLFHRDVFWCDWFDAQSQKIVDNTSELHPHLIQRLEDKDRSHDYDIVGLWMAFKRIKEMEEVKPFEVGTDLSGNVFKCVVRVPYNETEDICIVFRKTEREEFYLKTAWLCSKEDDHKTLNHLNYCTTI